MGVRAGRISKKSIVGDRIYRTCMAMFWVYTEAGSIASESIAYQCTYINR